MNDFEAAIELLKPQNWGYLAGLIGLMVFFQWWVKSSAKRKNAELKIDTDALSAEEIAKVWTKGQIKVGQHTGALAILIMGAALCIGLVFVAFDQFIVALVFMIGTLIAPLVMIRRLRVVDLMALDEEKFQELSDYFAANKDALITEALNDPEVIQAMAKWPALVRKFNLRSFRSKNFRPRRNQYD